MERWQNKIAVVTGANSGIGLAISKDLVEAGVKVIGLDRCTNTLDEYQKQLSTESQSLLSAIICNITDLESVNQTFDSIITQFGGVDILVNCAGCARTGHLVSMDPHEAETILKTNVMGMVYCTQRAFKSMKERGVQGHVVLINSMFGHKIIALPPDEEPSINMYAPSKHAVTAMSEIFRQEFWNLGTKIKVTSISPGLVDTPLPNKTLRTARKDCILSPHDVSNAVMFALSTPPHVLIHELSIRPMGDLG